MEKLSTFYDHITERFRSPLFFSFIISWLVINWRIPVYLFWFDEATLLQHGYKNHIEFIESVLGLWNSFLSPLIAALVYTFGYPQVKNWIAWYQTWVSKFGDKKRLKIADGSVMPFAKYDSKVKKLLQREKELAEMMKNEGEAIQEYSAKNTSLTAEVLELKKELINAEVNKNSLDERFKQTNAQLNKLQEATNNNRFTGIWNVDIENQKFEWRIDGKTINGLDENNVILSPASIEFSFWNWPKDDRIILMAHLMGDQKNWITLFPKHRIYANFHSNSEGTILTGNSAEGHRIVMRRIEIS